MPGPEGTIGHAELEIGDSVVMLSDPFPQSTVRPPRELGGTSVGLFVYVEDVDAVFERAVNEGATVTMALEDMFWGDRFGSVTDRMATRGRSRRTSRTSRPRRWRSARSRRWRP